MAQRASEILLKEAQKLREDAITKALAVRKASPTVTYSPIPHTGWSFDMLVREANFDFPAFIKKNADAKKMLSQEAIDINAFRVPQRGCGFLGQSEIINGKKLGTDNLQQCVALVVDGETVNGERKAMLMHVDKYTSKEEVTKYLGDFKNNNELKIIVYGARDQYRSKYDYETKKTTLEETPQRAISLDNLRIVNEAIDNLGLRSRVDTVESKVGIEAGSPNFIYDPKTRSAKAGVYPNGGFELAEATEKVRRMENLTQGKKFEDTAVPTIEERDKKLRIIPTNHHPGQYDIDPPLKCEMIKYYQEKGCTEFVREIEREQANAKSGNYEAQMKACSSLQYFMEMMQHTLNPPAVTMQQILEKPADLDIIVSEKIEQIQRNIVLKRQLKEVSRQVDEQPTPKDMGKAEVRLLAKNMIQSLTEPEKTSHLGDELKMIDHHLSQQEINKAEVQRLSKSAINRVENGSMQHFS